MKDIQLYSEFEAQLAGLEDTCNFLPDVSTDDGYEKSKRVSLDAGKVLTNLEKARKELKAESLEKGRAIDSEAKVIVAKIEAFQLPHKDAYKELDGLRKQREIDRKEALSERVRVIRELPESMADSDSNGVKMALESLQVEECLDFYEFTAEALKARNASKEALSKMFADKLTYEKEQVELAELRIKQAEQEQKDRDECIAKEAAAAAEAQAEEAKAAERRAIEQAALAVKQREAAEAAEEVQKEINRVDYHKRMIKHIEDCGNGFIGGEIHSYGILFHELEEKIVIDESFEEFREQAEKARDGALLKLKAMQEKDAERAEEAAELEERRQAEAGKEAEAFDKAKREANKKHIGKIRKAAKEDLMAKCDISEDVAKAVVLAIASGSIQHVTINY